MVQPVIHPLEHLAKQLPNGHAGHQLAHHRYHEPGDVEHRQADIQVILDTLATRVVIGLGIGNRQYLRIQLDLANAGIEKECRQLVCDRERRHPHDDGLLVKTLEKTETLGLVQVTLEEITIGTDVKLEGEVELEMLQ